MQQEICRETVSLKVIGYRTEVRHNMQTKEMFGFIACTLHTAIGLGLCYIQTPLY
jgi:hypothetical protein